MREKGGLSVHRVRTSSRQRAREDEDFFTGFQSGEIFPALSAKTVIKRHGGKVVKDMPSEACECDAALSCQLL